MVSNASELLPDPDNPVRTTSLSRGISMSIFLRLCSRAPRTLIRSCRAMKQRSSLGALGICGDSSEQTIAISQCSICRARQSGVSIRDEFVRRHDDHPLRWQLYQANRSDSNLILLGRIFVMLHSYSIGKAVVVQLESNGLILLLSG